MPYMSLTPDRAGALRRGRVSHPILKFVRRSAATASILPGRGRIAQSESGPLHGCGGARTDWNRALPATGPGPGEPHRRRPRRQRRSGPRPRRARRPSAAATWSRSRRWRVTGYPPEDLVLRAGVPRRVPGRDGEAGRRPRRRRSRRASRWSSATWTTTDGPRATPSRFLHRRRDRGAVLQAPPAQLRRLRRAPLLPSGRRVRRRPALRRRHRADDLRGPVAGRRPVRGRRRGRRRARRQHQRLAVRAEQGRRPAGAAAPPGAEAQAPIAVRQHRRRARTNSSSTATRWWSPPTAPSCSGRRSTSRGCTTSTSSCRPATDAGTLGDALGMRVERHDTGVAANRGRRPSRARASSTTPLPDEAEVWGALVLGPARLRTQERFPLGGARACPAASTRPSSRRSPRTRSAARTCTASRCRARTRPSTRAPTRATWPSASARTTGRCRSRRWSTRSFESLSLTGLAEENVQARVRGTTLMALSNAEGHLVLATGNKSELAVGYSTIYGDAVGGFAPIKDVPKTLVWKLARWRNADAESRGETPPIPRELDRQAAVGRAAARPARQRLAARLRAARRDPGALRRPRPGRRRDRRRGLRPRAGRATSAGMVDRAEWKRRQYPPGSKISFKAFGRDRRLPITNHWREGRRNCP